MFTHILLPSDGSPRSEAALAHAVALAAAIGARITGLHIRPEFHALGEEIALAESMQAQFEHESRVRAGQVLERIEAAARERGVEARGLQVTSDLTAQAIVDCAREVRADLIVMASHGRNSVVNLLMGSETQKVLAHCRIPVLVVR